MFKAGASTLLGKELLRLARTINSIVEDSRITDFDARDNSVSTETFATALLRIIGFVRNAGDDLEGQYQQTLETAPLIGRSDPGNNLVDSFFRQLGQEFTPSKETARALLKDLRETINLWNRTVNIPQIRRIERLLGKDGQGQVTTIELKSDPQGQIQSDSGVPNEQTSRAVQRRLKILGNNITEEAVAFLEENGTLNRELSLLELFAAQSSSMIQSLPSDTFGAFRGPFTSLLSVRNRIVEKRVKHLNLRKQALRIELRAFEVQEALIKTGSKLNPSDPLPSLEQIINLLLFGLGEEEKIPGFYALYFSGRRGKNREFFHGCQVIDLFQ